MDVPDDVIYNQLLDCHLSELGVKQARLLQPIINQFEFPEDKVYTSPLRRTMETLCNMLDSHPQKSRLTIVLIPTATEVLSLYGNIPITLEQKKAEF